MPLVNSDNHGIPANKLIHWLGSTLLFTITQLTLGFFLSKHIKTNSAPAFEGAWCHLQCPGHTENHPHHGTAMLRNHPNMTEITRTSRPPSGTGSQAQTTNRNQFPKHLCQEGLIENVAKPMQIPSGTASPNLLPGYCTQKKLCPCAWWQKPISSQNLCAYGVAVKLLLFCCPFQW